MPTPEGAATETEFMDRRTVLGEEKALDRRELPVIARIDIKARQDKSAPALTLTRLSRVRGVNALAAGAVIDYAGACVPVASDVDCAGGSGNGPAYVQGPVTIVGSDVYDLDRDGDGIACDQ